MVLNDSGDLYDPRIFIRGNPGQAHIFMGYLNHTSSPIIVTRVFVPDPDVTYGIMPYTTQAGPQTGSGSQHQPR